MDKDGDTRSPRYLESPRSGNSPAPAKFGYFGREGPDDSIYTRFFRSTLSYAVKSSVKSEDYEIGAVFHDDSHLANHKYFPRSAISRLRWDDALPFRDDRIKFIPSDHLHRGHPYPEDAEFIQVVDICIGAFRQVLSGASTHAGKNEVATAGLPFFQMLNDRTHQCGSARIRTCRFDHQRRSLSFFPRRQIDKNEASLLMADLSRAFYRGEVLAMSTPDEQMSLF